MNPLFKQYFQKKNMLPAIAAGLRAQPEEESALSGLTPSGMGATVEEVAPAAQPERDLLLELLGRSEPNFEAPLADIARGAEKINQGLTGVAPDDIAYQARLKRASDEDANRKALIKHHLAQKLAQQNKEDDRRFQVAQRENQQLFQAKQGDLNRKANITAAGLRLGAAQDVRDEAKALKKEEYSKGAAIPGFKLDESKYKPREVESSELRQAKTSTEDLIAQLDELSAMVKENGFETVPTDTTKSSMAGRVAALKLAAKDAAKLGVLSRTDMDMLDSLIGDPTSFWQRVTNLNSFKNLLVKYEDLKSRAKNGLLLKAKNLGYSSAEDPKAESGAPATKKVGGKVYRKVEGGWETDED